MSYKQVRARSGGGTRLIRVRKTARKEDILAIGMDRFFPKCICKKGPSCQFTITLCDFKQSEVTDATAVGELYEICSMRTLRFYMCSKRIKATTDNSFVYCYLSCRKKNSFVYRYLSRRNKVSFKYCYFSRWNKICFIYHQFF